MSGLGDKSIKRQIFAVFFILAAAALSFQYKDTEENILMNSGLKDFVVPPITLNGQTYHVTEGRVQSGGKKISKPTETTVKRTAYSSILNRLDPIMSLGGTDPDKLEKSINELDISLKRIAALYEKKNEATINNSLYPINFLKTLPETERARRLAVNTPSLANTQSYYLNSKKTIEQAIVYTKQLEQVYRDNESGRDFKFHFLGGYGTIKKYIAALESARVQMEEKNRELDRRMKCLENFSENCPSLKGAFNNFTASTQSKSSTRNEAAPTTVLNNKKLIDSYLHASAVNEQGNRDSSILLAIDNSSCFAEMPVVYYQTWLKSDKEQNDFFTITLLNDLFFYRTKDNANQFTASMDAMGLPYLYQSVTNLYMCQSIGDDLTRAIALDTIRSIILNKMNSYPPSDSLAALEKAISDKEIIYASDVSAYIEQLKSLLSANGETRLSEKIGAGNVLQIENLISIYANRSPRFDEIIRAVVSNNSIVEAFMEYGVNVKPDGLFLSRSYPSILLLSYNKSFFSEPLKSTAPEPLNLSGFKLVSYNKILKKEFGENKVLEMMRLGSKIQQKAINN